MARLLPSKENGLLTYPTLEQLRQSGWHGARLRGTGDNTRGADLDHVKSPRLLFDSEMADRQDRRLRARLRWVCARHNVAVEDVNYRTERSAGGR